MSCFLTTCALTPVCKAVASQGYPMKTQFSAHPKQDGSKKSTKNDKRAVKGAWKERGEGGKMEVRSSWGLGWPEAPFSAVFLGGRATGPARRGSGRYRRPTRFAIWRQCDVMKGGENNPASPWRRALALWHQGTKAFIQTRREQGEQAEKRGQEVKEKVVGSEAQGRRARGKRWRQWPVDSRAPAGGGGGEEPA